MREKGRQVRGDDHGCAKLTAEVVRAIRERYTSGGITQKELGAEYGVGRANVSLILSRKIWQHI